MIWMAAEERHIDLIRDRIDLLEVEDAKGIACELNGEILCVCMMDTWLENSVQMHIVIENPICLKNYALLVEAFNYVFNTSDRGVALAVVASDNKKSLRFVTRIGFNEIATIKDGHKVGVDTILFEMRKENCMWISHKQEAA